MKKIVVAAVIALVSIESRAANWVQIAQSDVVVASVDTTSKAKVGQYTKAWFLYNHKSPQTLAGGAKYRSTLVMNYFDCAAKTMAMKQVVHYSGLSKEGDLVQSNNYQVTASDMDDVIPDSLGEAAFEAVCGTRK